jgi:hypothetical protein
VRVEYPLEARFAGENFEVNEFTLNLSVSGIFLPTEKAIEPRTLGDLTFRSPDWSRPLTVAGEVVRTVPAGDPSGQPQGLGIQFLDLTPDDSRRLETLVLERQNESAVDAIRSLVREGKDLLTVLRGRPTGQKLMLATRAQSGEFDALIRDGNPTVISRLLENPRLTVAAIKLILRQPTSPPAILMKIKRLRLLAHPELGVLYCMHPLAPLQEVLIMLPHLPAQQLEAIERGLDLRPQLRRRARELLASRTTGAAAGGTGRRRSNR